MCLRSRIKDLGNYGADYYCKYLIFPTGPNQIQVNDAMDVERSDSPPPTEVQQPGYSRRKVLDLTSTWNFSTKPHTDSTPPNCNISPKFAKLMELLRSYAADYANFQALIFGTYKVDLVDH